MADLGSNSTNAGDFSGALITGIVVSIVLVTLIGGLILLAALYWRNVARKISPNKFETPHSEKSWPNPPGQSLDWDNPSIKSSPASSRSGSIRQNDPVICKEMKPVSPDRVPTVVFERPFLATKLQTQHPAQDTRRAN
ncbi:hypothetical protein BKA67DRAFT_648651 [Truncatella angustata]|uniref:Uncharacterized protein n=1 Tax=Truncatella angustata TaxID=152316 RepID=A0A9P8UET0_9PEZI|nr:uncharacterized protein BKA67DRAFT_648651 [Truncatella angustata]KAH6648645.1 hypothetical protein BKA67DRAFT_648651 [Truncatella angustata]KAH8194995.1 hypothetical protein TruAng_010834 [Truncatella angustata]